MFDIDTKSFYFGFFTFPNLLIMGWVITDAIVYALTAN